MARILVVDDDPNSRKIVELMLMTHGHELYFAEDGLQALELAPAGFDLILMDLLMPHLNGFEATRRLRRDPRTARTPIMALTAMAFEQDRREALAVGCCGYLCKPFTRRELVAAVQQYLPESTVQQALA